MFSKKNPSNGGAIREERLLCSVLIVPHYRFPAHISDLPQHSAIWPSHSRFSMWTVRFTKTELSVPLQLTWHYSLSWQVLLVFSDGLDDTLENLKKAADSLRFRGIITVLCWCSSLLLPKAWCTAPPLQLFHITLPLHAHVALPRSPWQSISFSVWSNVHDDLSLFGRWHQKCAMGGRGSSFWSPAPTAGAVQDRPLSLMRTAPDVRYNTDFSRKKQV